MNTRLHRVIEDRTCCDGLCQQGRHCPVDYACAVERFGRVGWFGRFCRWLNKLAGL